jgi:hypothetical protein
MDNQQTIEPTEPQVIREPRIPSSWRLMHGMTEAMQLLEANPDLVEDEDIQLALSSEVPNVELMLTALVGAVQAREDRAKVTRQRAQLLQDRARRIEASEQKLREVLVNVLQGLRVKSFSTPCGTVGLQNVGGKVTVTDIDKLPAEFVTVETVVTKTAKTKDIRAALKEKKTVEGAVLGNDWTTVRIQV